MRIAVPPLGGMPNRRKQPHAVVSSSLWRGKVICARCGAPTYPLHQKVMPHKGSDSISEFLICSIHRNILDKAESHCFANTFSAKVLHALLADTIRTVSRYALENEDDFLQKLKWRYVKMANKKIKNIINLAMLRNL